MTGILPRDCRQRLHSIFCYLDVAALHSSMIVGALLGCGFHKIVYYFRKDKLNRSKNQRELESAV